MASDRLRIDWQQDLRGPTVVFPVSGIAVDIVPSTTGFALRTPHETLRCSNGMDRFLADTRGRRYWYLQPTARLLVRLGWTFDQDDGDWLASFTYAIRRRVRVDRLGLTTRSLFAGAKIWVGDRLVVRRTAFGNYRDHGGLGERSALAVVALMLSREISTWAIVPNFEFLYDPPFEARLFRDRRMHSPIYTGSWLSRPDWHNGMWQAWKDSDRQRAEAQAAAAE